MRPPGTTQLNDATQDTRGGITYQVISCNVAPKQMADVIHVQLQYSANNQITGIGNIVDCSVSQYLKNVLPAEANTLRSLLVSIANYGAAAQTYFNYNTANLTNAFLDADDQNLSVVDVSGTDWQKYERQLLSDRNDFSEADEKVKFKSATLVLENQVRQRMYVTVDDTLLSTVNTLQMHYRVKDTGAWHTTTLQPVDASTDANLYYADIAGIAPCDLDLIWESYVSDGETTLSKTLVYSPYSYVYSMLSNSESHADISNYDQLQQLLYSLVDYCNATQDYYF